MQTPHRWFGAGHSTVPDSAKAGAEAASCAIGGRTPAVVFVFCSDQHDLPALLHAVREEAGPDAAIVGATTLGEVAYDGASTGGVAVAALGGKGFTVRTALGHIQDGGEHAAGAAAATAMTGMTSANSVLIMLCDGTAEHPHEVVRGAYSVLGTAVPMVGGFAGNEPGQQQTYQFTNDTIFEDAVIGVAVGSDGPIGIGVGHGWRRQDPPMIVTKSAGDRIFEIDDQPALDVLGQHTAVLGVARRSGEDLVAIHSVDEEDRSVRVTAEVPHGALCWLMESDLAALVEGATESCTEALEGLGGRTPLGALAFDCGHRRGRLGPDGVRDEMRAMRGVLGSTPYVGCYGMGEIARIRGALGTHALTVVTLALA